MVPPVKFAVTNMDYDQPRLRPEGSHSFIWLAVLIYLCMCNLSAKGERKKTTTYRVDSAAICKKVQRNWIYLWLSYLNMKGLNQGF